MDIQHTDGQKSKFLWKVSQWLYCLKWQFQDNFYTCSRKKIFVKAIPRDLNIKNGYIPNFYEKLVNDFIVQIDNFRTIFMLVHEELNFFEAIPKDLNIKNGYIPNFYEKLVNDFFVQNDNFRTIFMLVHKEINFFWSHH